MKKSILFIVFAIPVIITLVLRFFGENTFTVPIYYEPGISSSECGISTNEQYRITAIGKTSFTGKTSIVFFDSDINSHLATTIVELERVLSTKDENYGPQILAIDYTSESNSDMDNFTTVIVKSDDQERIANCDLLISQQPMEDIYSTLVLVDRQGRIRGYFNGSDQEDFDRLSAEMDILELEYQKYDE